MSVQLLVQKRMDKQRMPMKRLLTFQILLVQWFILGQAKRNFYFIGTKLECFNNLPKLINCECHMEQRGNRTYYSGRGSVTEPLYNIKGRAVLTPLLPSMSRLHVFDVTVDPCIILREGPKNFFLKYILKNVRKFVNEMPTDCPPKTHFNYTVKDAYVNEEELLSFAPEGKYRAEVYGYVNELLIATLVAEGDIVYYKRN